MTADERRPGLEAARAYAEAGSATEAIAEAWAVLDRAPDDRDAKSLIADILRRTPGAAPAERLDGLGRLLVDPEVEPSVIARSAWHLLSRPGQKLAELAGDPEPLAHWAEKAPIAARLLEESPVTMLDAEQAMTGLRAWLLLSGKWAGFPRLTAALAAQARRNGGAWLISKDERERLDSEPGAAIAAAYFPPPPPAPPGPAFADPVTEAVADQYRHWPYPAWSRVTPPEPTTVPAWVEAIDFGRPSGLPVAAELLVAGCGTGREAALWALRFPDARITAIDLSETSLAYARERCRSLGLDRIDFRRLDIHDSAELGRQFDFIACSGVLHHLPDPEGGWAALAAVLKPGGAMRIMLYSRIARLKVQAARHRLADLLDRPVDAGLLREARRRLIEQAPGLLSSWTDFYTLPGVHDLLLHRHEDPFDVPRIVRALDRLGLELLAFHLPTPSHRARYRAEHPDDPGFRDVEAWSALEKRDPFLFQGMYNFHCRKPAA